MTKAAWRPAQRILDLLDWIGDGRRLTQTDRLTLADARTLVPMLGTGDVIDPVVYGTPTRTTSSGELAELSLLVDWARAAGLVRTVRHKLVRVKRHASLARRPEAIRDRLFDALTASNFVLDPYPGFESLVCADYGRAFSAIAVVLYPAEGPVSIADVHRCVWEQVSARWAINGDALEREQRRCASDVDQILQRAASLGSLDLDSGQGTVALTELGRSDIARWRGEPVPGDEIWRIRAALADMPGRSVWRSIELAPATTLPTLHKVLQAAFDWEDYHLHTFTGADGTEYGASGGELDLADETAATLADLFDPFGAATYLYDLGDDWQHRLTIEVSGQALPGQDYPRCVAGAGACPPEDCGGTTGYANLLAILADPGDEEHQGMLAWLGLTDAREFDPDAFDAQAAQQRLHAMSTAR